MNCVFYWHLVVAGGISMALLARFDQGEVESRVSSRPALASGDNEESGDVWRVIREKVKR